jgi:hypothetical protein
MTELDARQLAQARLLTDPRFWNGKMFGKLLGVQKAREGVALVPLTGSASSRQSI